MLARCWLGGLEVLTLACLESLLINLHYNSNIVVICENATIIFSFFIPRLNSKSIPFKAKASSFLQDGNLHFLLKYYTLESNYLSLLNYLLNLCYFLFSFYQTIVTLVLSVLKTHTPLLFKNSMYFIFDFQISYNRLLQPTKFEIM